MNDIFDDLLSKHIRITHDRKKGLTKLGIVCVKDLLYHFPTRYLNQSTITPIRDIAIDGYYTTTGRIVTIEVKSSFKTKVKYVEVVLEDMNGDKLKCIWFNQIFISKVLTEGSIITVTGNCTIKGAHPSMINPSYDERDQMPIDQGNSLFKDSSDDSSQYGEAIYKETQGVSSLFLRHAIRSLLEKMKKESINPPDPIPEYIRTSLKLPDLVKSLIWIHMPANQNQATSARKRFSFEYIFLIQVAQQYIRNQIAKAGAIPLQRTDTEYSAIVNSLPFTLTNGQMRICDTIRNDLSQDIPMQRLLEGDVGSGKTAIASIASNIAIDTNAPNGISKYSQMQVAYMAPTEVLATQLFESFISFFKKSPTSIVLLTGKTCKKFPSKSNPTTWTTLSKAQAKKWIASGEINIVVGTHALISKGVEWKHLGLVIIDEQHRFGTKQRAKLAQSDGHIPHYLSMSATPMPRTLALTLYGDLDISVLDEVPPGRKPVITEVATPQKRENIYTHMKAQLAEGRQCYVICPRIDTENDDDGTVQKRSAVTEAKRLQEDIFTEYTVGVMHGKLGKQEKEKVMNDFASGKIDILVSTTVVEVGVNVPNASVILIEGAERFGLSQMHQLRGRVMRSTHQPYCYLFMEGSNSKSVERIKKFVEAKNGFELAEMDLHSRGAGDLLGAKQWGISDIGMDAIKNIKLVETAQVYAKEVLTEDPELRTNPPLEHYVLQYDRAPHLE